MFPLDGHQVNAGHPFHLFEFFNLLAGDLDPLIRHFSLARTLEAFDEFIRDIHTRNVGFHVSGHTHALHGGYSGKNGDLFRQPHVVCLFDPFFKAIHVVDTLGLDKIDTGIDLFCQSEDPPLKGIGKRVGCGADKNLRRRVDVAAREKLCLIPHLFDHADQLNGIDIKHSLCLGMVSEFLMIARKTEHVPDAVGIDAQNIRLHGQPVAVPADHLEIGLEPFLNYQQARRPAGHPNHRGLVVRNIDRIHNALKMRRFSPYIRCVRPTRGAEFAGKRKVTGS